MSIFGLITCENVPNADCFLLGKEPKIGLGTENGWWLRFADVVANPWFFEQVFRLVSGNQLKQLHLASKLFFVSPPPWFLGLQSWPSLAIHNTVSNMS